MILRDYLATDRTILANERTFLAYLRTALAFVIVGVSLIEFFNKPSIELLGWILIPLGLVCLLVGMNGYNKIKRKLQNSS